MLLRLLFPLLLAFAAPAALAQSCAINAPTLASAANYDPFAAPSTYNETHGAFTITCTRPTGGQNKFPGTFYFGATNGSNFSTTRRLRLGATGNYLTYLLWRDVNNVNCVGNWSTTSLAEVYQYGNSNTGPNNTTTNPNPLADQDTYCFRILNGSNTAPPGTYTDLVQLAIGTSITDIWGLQSLQLSTTIVPTCRFEGSIPNIPLAYNAFQAASATNSRTFQLKCTNTTSYTIGFDSNSGTVLGLTYNLGLNQTTGVGNGLVQSYTITATIPAGQPGACGTASCTGSSARSVLITY